MKSLLEVAEGRGSIHSPLSRARRLAVAAMEDAPAQEEGVIEKQASRGRPLSRRGSGRQLRNIGPLLEFWDPFGTSRSMKEVLNAFDRMIDSPFLRTPASTFPSRVRLPHDFVEDTDVYRLRIDMPGFSKEEVKVTVEDDQLVIKGEQNTDKSDDGWSSHSYENFNTRLTLPEHVKVDEVKAELKNGMLRIVIPKAKEDPKPNAIPIEVH